MRKKPSQMAHQVPLEKPINQKIPSLPTLQEPEEISKSNINCMEQGSTSPKRHENDGSSSEEIAVLEGQASAAGDVVVVDHEPSNVADEDSGRERLKKHRVEVAGQIWIPDVWGQEELLQDWIDCSAFDASLFPSGIMSARSALVEEGRRQNSARIRIENRLFGVSKQTPPK
ncbi:protein BIC1-like [Prunus avium]|uniref:Protein BIC1-like n=1 Tax=Prunus avium TaxID=42229 RepID=A0A6P5U372_PRUAV|nr:protein BIC1-like [Prunus avium]